MSAHAPGPWRASFGAIIPPGKGHFIASVNRRNPNAEANALLIAAAPELLAALRDLLSAIGGEESTDIWCQNARAAIAKATP